MEATRMVVDTSVFIDHLRAKHKARTILSCIPNETEIFISSVTIYELLLGATNAEKWNDVELITQGLPILTFTGNVAKRAAQIFHELKKENSLIEFRDIFIAATALIYRLPILTINTKHFKRVKGVQVVEIAKLKILKER